MSKQGFLSVKNFPNYFEVPTTCYSRKERERGRPRVNENLCGGTKRASRPRMHVRATNADRKSIKRLLHPRHSAAAPPHENQPLSSLFIPPLPPPAALSRFSFSLPPPFSFFVPPLMPTHPTPYRSPSSREKRFLSSGPVNLKTILRRCTLLRKGVPFWLEEDVFARQGTFPLTWLYFGLFSLFIRFYSSFFIAVSLFFRLGYSIWNGQFREKMRID